MPSEDQPTDEDLQAAATTPVPAVQDEIDETTSVAAPTTGLFQPKTTDHSTGATRRIIAYGLLVILGALVLTGCVGWVFLDRDKADFQAFAVMFSPIVTLVGTVLAFYYGSRD